MTVIPDRLHGYLLAGGGAALFSMKAIIIKIAYGEADFEVDAILLLGLRMAFALPLYLAIGTWLLRRRNGNIRDRLSPPLVIAAALVGVLGYYFAAYMDFLGLMFITAQLERLVLFTYPLFVMVLGSLFFGSRMTLWGVLSLLIAYSGVTLVYFRGGMAVGNNVTAGVALVLTAAFAFAFYQLLARSIMARTGSMLFTCIALAAAATVALSHLSINAVFSDSGPVLADVPVRIYWLAAVLGIATTVLPSFMINAGLERIGAEASSMIHTLSPLVTIVLAVIVLGEPFTAIDAAGSLLVIAGVGLYTWKDSRKAVSPVSGSAVLHARTDDRP
jgi:drug/metabolite transporter (DMT)-like permease